MTATSVRKRPASEAFRFVLRRFTTVAHESLDGHPAFAALMSGKLTLGGYRRLMALFQDFYQCHDPVIAQACSTYRLDQLGFAYAPRSGVLESDLAALGATASPAPQGADCRELGPIKSAGTLGGVLYVLEGSLLGGGVLCREVEALLSASGADGYAYWRWCCEAGGARWAMTCAMIEALSAKETDRVDMISGAQATFEVFADSLARWQGGS